MTDRNTVDITGENPETSITFVHYETTFSDEQCKAIEGILSKAEQEILRYLQQQAQTPEYPDNAVTEDRFIGYTYP